MEGKMPHLWYSNYEQEKGEPGVIVRSYTVCWSKWRLDQDCSIRTESSGWSNDGELFPEDSWLRSSSGEGGLIPSVRDSDGSEKFKVLDILFGTNTSEGEGIIAEVLLGTKVGESIIPRPLSAYLQEIIFI